MGVKMRYIIKFVSVAIFITVLFDGCSFLKPSGTISGLQEYSPKTEVKEEDVHDESEEVVAVTADDKQAVLEKYEEQKADYGKYYYIWESSKYEIPLLLITDYCVTDTEETKIFGIGSAYECSVYFADPDNDFEMKKMGKLEALSSSYPLAYSEDGLFVANNHFVYQFIPDYKNCSLTLWCGFEDNVVNIVGDHEGWIEVVDSEVVKSDDVDTNIYYEMYYSAKAVSFIDAVEVKKPTEVYNLSNNKTISDEMAEYAINLLDNGRYSDYEGDIGDVLAAYKDIDIDGDGQQDKIERIKDQESEDNGVYYRFLMSSNHIIKTKTFSMSPNEGEVIELKDLDGDNRDEILVTHYTYSTGGPRAWDVYLFFYNDNREWDSITLIDNHIQIQDIGDEYGYDINEYEDVKLPDGSYERVYLNEPNIVAVELTDDGISMLVDNGSKDGAEQTFDLDVFLFRFDGEGLSLGEHSSDLLNKYWPKHENGLY